MNIMVRAPHLNDEAAFLAMTNTEKGYHHPWVQAPLTATAFQAYLKRYQQDNQKSYVVVNESDNILGVFNVSEIVRGAFQSAFLGFYGSQAVAGKGVMSCALKHVLKKVFIDLALHRVEANVQPGNEASIRLVRNNGFQKEGFSPCYLKVGDRWEDHERWALTIENWSQS